MRKLFNILCVLSIISICGCAPSKVGHRYNIAMKIKLDPTEEWIKEDFKHPIASAQTYNSQNALALARICRLVWEEDQIVIRAIANRWSGPDSNIIFENMPDTDSQYLIFGNSDFTVVAFRATQTKLGDIWTVLKYQSWETIESNKPKYYDSIYKNIPIGNAGFRESVADCFASGLTGKLTLFRNGTGANNAPLFLTGHSLGGAIALLSRQKLEMAGLKVDSVYLFGTPVSISNIINDPNNKDSAASKYNSEYGSTTFFHRYSGDNVPRLRPSSIMYSPPGWSKELCPDGTKTDYSEYETMNLLTRSYLIILDDIKLLADNKM